MLARQLVNLHLDRKRGSALVPASPRHERYRRRVAAASSAASRTPAEPRALPEMDGMAAGSGAVSATRWGGHVATSLSVGKKLRCVYCCERAETAVRNGLEAPFVSCTNFFCSVCVRPVKRGCSTQVPLCIKPRPGLRSCFMIYHEARAHASCATLAMDEQ